MAERPRYQDLCEVQGTLSPAEYRFERARRSFGLVVGPALFALLLLHPPAALAPPAARLLAVLGLTLTWWLTEAVPLPVAALLAPTLSVLLGVGDAREMFAAFGDPVLFLFLGSFLLAEGMFGSGLDRRIAFGILSRPAVGSSAGRILIAFALTTALLSMWLSNTATTAMLFPIALSVLAAFGRLAGVEARRLRYGTALMLTCAWASSIGGVGTPVGTPPNLIVLGLLERLTGSRPSFFQWMAVGVPIAAVLLVILVLYLRWALPPERDRIEGGGELLRAERAALGRIGRAEKNVLAAFAAAVVLWIAPGLVSAVAGPGAPAARWLGQHLPESTVALLAGLLLFVLPVDFRARRFTLNWTDAARIDWGTLMLFGGGLSLGGALERTGLARAAGDVLVGWTGARSSLALCLLFAFASVFLTDAISNTAAATILAPLSIAAAQQAGVSPMAPAMVVALGSSMAFTLPVSTPPNAIVYGSGAIPITAMIKHGLVMDFVSATVIGLGVLPLVALAGL